MQWKTRAKIWLWAADSSWHFVTVPKSVASGIKTLSEGMRSPTGSVRVVATIKDVSWKTSLFPTKQRTYLLPVKAEVRKKAKVGAGDTVALTLELES
jgi:hypothetical protein